MEISEISQKTERHCAWCGDPPDEHGSHGICPEHAAQIAAQAQARRERRNQQEAA